MLASHVIHFPIQIRSYCSFACSIICKGDKHLPLPPAPPRASLCLTQRRFFYFKMMTIISVFLLQVSIFKQSTQSCLAKWHLTINC